MNDERSPAEEAPQQRKTLLNTRGITAQVSWYEAAGLHGDVVAGSPHTCITRSPFARRNEPGGQPC